MVLTKVFKVNPGFILMHLSQGVDPSLFPFLLLCTARGEERKLRLPLIRAKNILAKGP